MAYASRLGRAKISPQAPAAAGACDRCGFIYSHSYLRWQFDYRGTTLQNTRMLVCRRCEDQPQPQLLARTLPADPVPIQNPRPFNWAEAETDYRTTSGQNSIDPITGIPVIGGDTRITQGGEERVTQQTGQPVGGTNQEPGTDPNAPGNDDPGLPYNNNTVPETGPL